MSRPEAKWTSTAGTATIFGQREILSGESRLKSLNADSIYAAMVAIRDHMESSEEQAAYRALLEEKSEKADSLRELLGGTGGQVYVRPVCEFTDDQKEEIYPGKP